MFRNASRYICLRHNNIPIGPYELYTTDVTLDITRHSIVDCVLSCLLLIDAKFQPNWQCYSSLLERLITWFPINWSKANFVPLLCQWLSNHSEKQDTHVCWKKMYEPYQQIMSRMSARRSGHLESEVRRLALQVQCCQQQCDAFRYPKCHSHDDDD